jgi:hypothetical protein
MARTGRSSAGRSVRLLAARYSSALLGRELGCFRLIDEVFAAQAKTGTRLLLDRWPTPGDGSTAGPAYDVPLRTGLARIGGAALFGSRRHVATLAVSAAALGVVSIGQELAVCEAAVPARYAGIAAAGEDTALLAAGGLADAGLDRYEQAETAVLASWRRDSARQLLVSWQRDEDLLQASLRLFSPKPVRLPGCSGVGAWWRTAAQLHAAAREVAIGVGNRVRSAGMDGFNAGYAARSPAGSAAAPVAL